MGRDHREHTPGAKARFAEARDAKAKALAYLEAKTLVIVDWLFEDAGYYIVVVGVGCFGVVQKQVLPLRGRMTRFWGYRILVRDRGRESAARSSQVGLLASMSAIFS